MTEKLCAACGEYHESTGKLGIVGFHPAVSQQLSQCIFLEWSAFTHRNGWESDHLTSEQQEQTIAHLLETIRENVGCFTGASADVRDGEICVVAWAKDEYGEDGPVIPDGHPDSWGNRLLKDRKDGMPLGHGREKVLADTLAAKAAGLGGAGGPHRAVGNGRMLH